MPVALQSQAKSTLNQLVIDGLRWLSISTSVVYIISISIDLIYNTIFNVSVLLFDSLMMLLFAVLFAFTTKRLIPIRWAHAVATIAAFLVTFNVLFSVTKTNLDTFQFLPYMAIVLGSVMLSKRWLIFTLLIMGAATMTTVVLLLPEYNDKRELILMLLTASIISVGICTKRIKNQLRIIKLRDKDAESRSELKKALSRIEKEFYDHKQTIKDRTQLEGQLRESQKLEAIGILAGGIAHDMNNVLGAISINASLIKEEITQGDPKRSDIDGILLAAKRGGEFTRNLLSFARKGKFKKKRLKLSKVVFDVTRLLQSTLPKEIQIHTDLESAHSYMEGDDAQLSQAIMNLCINASDAINGQGHLTITTQNVMLDTDNLIMGGGRYVKLQVSDSGIGMDQDTMERVFEPFYTTKKQGEGTGLGLSMVYRVVQNHGGRISIESTPDIGTTVTILLPRINKIEDVADDKNESKKVILRKIPETVLLVDDEEMIRIAATRILKKIGCKVHSAANGQDAIDIYKKSSNSIDLVILDMSMPVMGGAECFKNLRDINPDVKVLISSGYADDTHTDALMSLGSFDMLPKPYNFEEMRDAVSKIAESQP